MADTILTKLADLIDPEVMADMISAKIPDKIRVAPFAKVDDTLAGVPGNTITVPSYGYIGDAEDVAEGVDVDIDKMSTKDKKYKIKKAMKGVGLTDEAVLSGYGNPVGEANAQLALAIAAKIDNDCMEALQGATLVYDGTAAAIKYSGVVDAIDVFNEEINSDKVMFINPKQMSTLRKDADFISADKYQAGVAVTGEIGKIANTRVVASRKVPSIEYEKDNSTGTIEIVADTTTETSTKKHLATIQPHCAVALVVGDKVKAAATAYYACPIVKLNEDSETEDDVPALTIYRKRNINVETERKQRNRSTEITADEFYVAALTNEAKVVLAKFKK